jgi:hypothetical protein
MADRFESSTPTARPFVEFRPLLRALGIASDTKKLILAILGLLLVWAGWSFLAWAMDPPLPWLLPIPLGFDLEAAGDLESPEFLGTPSLIVEPLKVVVTPFASLFFKEIGLYRWFQTALMAVWAVAVWGIFGGAIARIAVVQAAVDNRVGMLSALKFALKKSSSLIGAPLTPLFAVGLFAGACAIFGLIARIPWSIGSTFALVFGLVPVVLGLVMALILIGLAIGWPLMVATVAAESEDAPDALSRSYSYVNQRLPRYVVHLIVSGLIGLIGLGLSIAFARVVLGLADWGVTIGAGSKVPPLGGGLAFWQKVAGVIVHAWVYSYFWSSASIIYLILRRDVDGTPWHDVYLPEYDADTFAGDLDSTSPATPEKVEISADAEKTVE